MPIPSSITDLSATAAANYPAGSDSPTDGDNVIRAHGAFIRQLYDGITAAAYPTFAGLADTTDVTKGDAFVGVKSTKTGSVGTTQHKVNERVIHLFDFLSAAQINDYQTRALTLDLTTPLQAAIDALSAGDVLELDTGSAKITAALNITNGGVSIRGKNHWSTVIKQYTTNVKIFNVSADNFYLSEANLSYNGTPVSGADAIAVGNNQTCGFCNLWISSCWNGISMTSGGNHHIVGYWCYSYENTALLLSSTIDVQLSVFRFHAGNSIRGRLGGIRLQGPVEGSTFSQGDITLGVYGLTTADFGSNARGSAPYFNRFSQVYLDSPLQNPAYLRSLCHSDFVGCWFSSGGHDEAVGFGSAGDYSGIDADTCEFLTFTGGDCFANGGRGALIYATNKRIAFSGTRFKRNQFSRSSDGAAISILANGSDFYVTDCIFERDADTTTYRQLDAVNVQAGTSDRYLIESNLLGGCTVTDGGSGANKSVARNY